MMRDPFNEQAYYGTAWINYVSTRETLNLFCGLQSKSKWEVACYSKTTIGNFEGALVFSVERDYSQYGEQEIVLDYFANYTGPLTKYCIDAGAFDGIVGSNSRALFQNGWSGVAIEPNPRTFRRLAALYRDRDDIACVQAALSDSPRTGVLMQFSIGPSGIAEDDKWQYAQVSTLHDYFADSYKRGYGYLYEASEVDLVTLESVLEAVGAPVEPGFLSIDCEGEDIKIVRAFDFSKYRPLLICVESDERHRHIFSEALEGSGFIYHAHTAANTFFKRSPGATDLESEGGQ